jgi:hypothetical protein
MSDRVFTPAKIASPGPSGGARTVHNLGLDADASYVPFLDDIGAAFGALGYPKPLLLCYTKVITPTHLAAYRAAGFPVALIFEVGARNSLGGDMVGTTDGNHCVRQMGALGAPKGAGVYLTSDTDVGSDADLELVEAYFAAADAEIFAAGYRIGGYADGTELMELHSHGLNFEWLAGAMGWDGSRELLGSGTPDIVQGIIRAGGSWMGFDWPAIDGLNYDPNLVYSADVGQI